MTSVRCVVFALDASGPDGSTAWKELDGLAGRCAVGLISHGSVAVDPIPRSERFAFRLDPDHLGIDTSEPRLYRVAAAAAGCHPSELVVVVGPDLERSASDAIRAAGARLARLAPDGAAPPAGTHVDAVIADVAGLATVLAGFDREAAARAGEVGVGPHPEPWPSDPRLDPVLLAHGDRRNVVDRYRYWREDAIVADLALRAHPFHVAIENWRHDRNIGAVVRNANAFGAGGVHVVGRRRWNRRGAMATDRYLPVHHHATVHDLVVWANQQGLAIVGIDNVDGAVALEHTDLPERCVLVLGQEGPGLSAEARAAAAMICAITQYGSTRSVNAGVASGIAMHAWARRHGRSDSA